MIYTKNQPIQLVIFVRFFIQRFISVLPNMFYNRGFFCLFVFKIIFTLTVGVKFKHLSGQNTHGLKLVLIMTGPEVKSSKTALKRYQSFVDKLLPEYVRFYFIPIS